MDIKYHKSCSTLPIYNFHKMMEEGNLCYLIKGYSEDEEEVVVGEEAGPIFQKILEEYALLTSNNEVLVGLEMQINISILEYERNVLERVLFLFNKTKETELLNLLPPFGFVIEPKENVNALLEKVISRVKGLKNKIKINKSKYAERFKKNTEEIKSDLEKQALILELNLSLGREINVRNTTVLKWIHMIEVSSKKATEMEKSLNKR